MSERILIVSVTHGRLNYFKEMLARTGKPDRLIHLGDSEGQQDEIARLAGCPVDIVRGNCDYSSDLAQDKLIEIGKYRVFLTHGHRYQVNFGIQTLKEAALLRGADIAMYGHTHYPENSVYGGIIVVNPGSVSQPRQLNHKPTYGILTVDDSGKLDVRIQYV